MNLNPDDTVLEDHLRARLRACADDLDLAAARGPRATITRARRRRHRRQGGLATVAAGALAAGVAVAAPRHQEATEPITSGAETPEPTTTLPPLNLSWQRRDGGLMSPVRLSYAFDTSGVLYALSTAPDADITSTAMPPAAVYRFGEDGSWTLAAQGDDVAHFNDLAADGELLYSVSTAPGTGGQGAVPMLSSSADGGRTWTAKTLVSPPSPPSAALPWVPVQYESVESVPGITAALVSTAFRVPSAWVKDQLPDPAMRNRVSGTSARPEGLAVLAMPKFEPPTPAEIEERRRDLQQGVTPTTAPGSPPPTMPEPEVLHVIPWARLGVSGPEALRPVNQMFLREGDAWTPVDVDVPVDDALSVHLASIGHKLALVASAPSGGLFGFRSTVLVSSDGRRWSPVTGIDDRQFAAAGSNWVSIETMPPSPVVHVSADDGATWQDRALEAVDPRLAGGFIEHLAGGPLGLAFSVRTGTGGSFVVTTRDLNRWTVTPATEILGDLSVSSIEVGADRIVVGGFRQVPGRADLPAETVTAVGTPVR
jgi:hypothetical protein